MGLKKMEKQNIEELRMISFNNFVTSPLNEQYSVKELRTMSGMLQIFNSK